MHKTSSLALGALIAGALLAAGCAAQQESRVDAEFGEAVREMIRLQTLDPGAGERNAATAPGELDGRLAERVLETYRKDASAPADVRDEITMETSGR